MLPTMLLVCMCLSASLSMTRLVDDQANDDREENLSMYPQTGADLTYGEKRTVSYPPQDRCGLSAVRALLLCIAADHSVHYL
jgi:hypothetical protein